MDFHRHHHSATNIATTAARRVLMREKSKYDDDDASDEAVVGGVAEEEEEDHMIDGEEKKQRIDMATVTGGGRRISSGGGGISCQADKCTADLTEAKHYHRRHKVCEFHAKAPAVLVSGLRQRFCQQCSRFHELPEFDDTKRSCRRRLAGHNERRRKSTSEPNNGSGSSSGRVKGPGPQCRPSDHESAGGSRPQMTSYQGNASFKYR